MKRLFIVLVIVVLGLILPLSVSAAGKPKPRRHKSSAARVGGCNRLKGKAQKRCEAKAAARAAAIERARRLAAIRYENQQKAIENKFRAKAAANIAKDDTTGEDLTIRESAIKALDGKGGTVVVMEAQTGKVLTIVNQDWAIRQAYKPCSTIKLVTGVAGLKENVVDEDSEDSDPNFSTSLDSVLPKPRPKSSMNLDRAIAKSNNGYFDRLGAKVGTEKFVSTAQTLGLGQKTGINAEGETAGRVPLVKKTGQAKLRYYSFGDGTEITPLQLGVLAAEIVNGGHKIKPFIEKTGFVNPEPTTLNVPQETLKGMIPGMQGAVADGTARRSGVSSLGVVGKTGTCSDEISRIGLFTSVAPVEKPKYTVVVVIRGRKDQTSGPIAARIAGRIYQDLLGKEVNVARSAKSAPVSKTQ